MPITPPTARPTLAAAVLGGATCLLIAHAAGDAIDRAVPAPVIDEKDAKSPETAVFAGGCFWGMQAVFEHVKGVTKVVAGYAGGAKSTATYDQVTTETTGHAESVQISFDPKQVSFGSLLRIFFSVAHDPTEVNRQGPDEGSSYRSEIFAESKEQSDIARAYIDQLDKEHAFSAPIATRVDTLRGFYRAEDYHQDFFFKNPDYPYIVMNDVPKVQALKRVFPSIYRDTAARLATSGPQHAGEP